MTEISRDPNDYTPTTHAGQQRKHRGIDWFLVRRAIEDGKVLDSHKPNCVVFEYDSAGTKHPIGVVANTEERVIITIEHRKQ